ncbi:MAG: SLBB domain-containing protein [Bacteroidetes bacterium]|nr:SLBB domain-containing protein [Bacteroidota bacterium]
MTNKTLYLIFLILISFASLSYSQIENLSPEQLKALAKSKGYNIGDSTALSLPGTDKNLELFNIKAIEKPTLTKPLAHKITSSFTVKEFSGRGSASGLQAFGYNIFNYSPTSFVPSTNVPVPNSYIFGPGDEIIITLWGETQLVQSLIVSKEGKIYIPDVGLISVNGLNLSEVKTKLHKLLAKSYSSLDASGKGRGRTHLDVSTGNLKSVKIYVLGEVNTPGGYTLPGLSTVFTALYYSGGPSINGSLRDVRVLRQGKVIASIDLYDYLLKGNQSKDVRLSDEDIIFIPKVGKRVAISGEIFRPSIYELKKGELLSDLIYFSGGLTFNSYFERVGLERIIPFTERDKYTYNILNIDLKFKSVDELNKSPFNLEDGDVVNIQKVNNRYQNKVTINGDVKKPGVYELKEGMTVRDLVYAADSLYLDAFLEKATLTRILPNEKSKVITFNLKNALAGSPVDNLLLENRDVVQIFKEQTFFPQRSVVILGEVKNPGSFLRKQNMTLTDLIIESGGLSDFASFKNVEISRLDTLNAEIFSQKFTIDLQEDYWNTPRENDFILEDYDKVFIRKDPNKILAGNISISGEVKFPGTYSILYEGEKLSDFVKRSGGLKKSAYINGIYIQRNNSLLSKKVPAWLPDSIKLRMAGEILFNQDIIDKYSGRIPIDWKIVLENPNSEDNIIMLPGDALIVPKNPNVIIVIGAVGLPSTVVYREGADLDYYISQAGGYNENAADGDEIVILPNGQKWDPGQEYSFASNILSGSVIIVPTSIAPKTNAWPIIRDVVSIITSAAVLTLTIKQLSK